MALKRRQEQHPKKQLKPPKLKEIWFPTTHA